MTDIPALGHGCGSWVVTCKVTGRAVAELFSARNVGRVNRERYAVEATNAYLARLNATIAEATKGK